MFEGEFILCTVCMGAHIATKAAHLIESCKINHIELRICNEGAEIPYNHSYHRIVCLSRWLKRLNPRPTYVVFIDAFDTFVTPSLKKIPELFEQHQGKVILGAERENWPERDQAWASVFPNTQSGRNFVNSGFVGGRTDVVIHALEELTNLYQQFYNSEFKSLKNIYWLREQAINIDQIMWQIAYYQNLFPIHLDSDAAAIANVTTDSLKLENNPFYLIEQGMIRGKHSHSTPGVIHLSGPGIHELGNWYSRYYGKEVSPKV